MYILLTQIFFKKFPDAPESKSYSQVSHMHMMSYTNAYTLKNKNEEDEQGRSYIFNDMSAVVYQV
jgi:hypothetical protein